MPLHPRRIISCRIVMTAGLVAVSSIVPASAQSLNPGRDYNQQLYERRSDPGAMSGPSYHPQNPGQQYNNLQYERRYRAPSAIARPRPTERQAGGENSPRVQSIKPARKTEEQIKRKRRQAGDDD